MISLNVNTLMRHTDRNIHSIAGMGVLTESLEVFPQAFYISVRMATRNFEPPTWQ